MFLKRKVFSLAVFILAIVLSAPLMTSSAFATASHETSIVFNVLEASEEEPEDPGEEEPADPEDPEDPGDPEDPSDPEDPEEPGEEEPGKEEPEEEGEDTKVPDTGLFTKQNHNSTTGGSIFPIIVLVSLLLAILCFILYRFMRKNQLGAFTVKKTFLHQMLYTSGVVVLAASIVGGAVSIIKKNSSDNTMAEDIRLNVTTSNTLSAEIYKGGELARVVDTVVVDTNANNYQIYVSAKNDGNLHNATTNDNIVPNTDNQQLATNSWGISTEEFGSFYNAVPSFGHDTLIADSNISGDNIIYYAAKAGDDLGLGEYSGQVEYTVVASYDSQLAITPSSKVGLDGGTEITITTPLVVSGTMPINAPEVLIGDKACTSPTVTNVGDGNAFITVSCLVPEVQVAGSYSVSVSFNELGHAYAVPEGFIYEEEEETPPITPEVYYTVTAGVNNPDYGTVDQSSIVVLEGTPYQSSGNKMTFGSSEDAVVITASPKTVEGYDTTCSGWTPSKGTVTKNMSVTAKCTATKKTYTITYKSGNGKNQTKTETKTFGEDKSITPLKSFAGARYSNVYSLNSEQYKNWTKEGFYFDYWSGNDGNKYIPDGDGYKNTCTNNCKTTYTGNADLTLTAHFTKMNGINKAAITLAWPAEGNKNDKMITSDIDYTKDDIISFFDTTFGSSSNSSMVSLAAPYNENEVKRFRLQSTPEFKAAAWKYFSKDVTGSKYNVYYHHDKENSLKALSSDGSSKYKYGYAMGRSCGVFAGVAIRYGLTGLDNIEVSESSTFNKKLLFLIENQSLYFADSDEWSSPNTQVKKMYQIDGTSGAYNKHYRIESLVSGDAGRSELDYLPGDIRIIYRKLNEGDNDRNRVVTYDNDTYKIGHIAIYVKTEDGVGHIAEAGVVSELYNDQSYYDNGGVWFFARTAAEKGGSFGRMTESYYSKKSEVYTIWRYNID